MKHSIAGLAALLVGGMVASLWGQTPATTPPAAPAAAAVPIRNPAAPTINREFRAAWVATVGNIDWPSRRGLTAQQQKDEAIAILDRAVALNLNAIVLQVRTSCDAFYVSDLEPWSEYLTGEQGKNPGYDPLAFWINEAHRRGIELHAWFNPYRARAANARGAEAASHISKTHPDAVFKYGNMLWCDPGNPATSEHTLAVMLDVVRRYDLDGVHMDDYFYPYVVKAADGKTDVPFPDAQTYAKYKTAGGTLELHDWRRRNVNDLVKKLYDGIKREKPHVKFGISPFGIWRPGNPPGIKGLDQYDVLFADAKLWLNEGWVDYFTPQLYWPIEQKEQSFPVLLDWWIGENKKGRHMWPGGFTSRMGDRNRAFKADEIPNQILITRKTGKSDGYVHFSMIALQQNRAGIADTLRNGVYADVAAVPASPWLGRTVPGAPVVAVRGVEGGEKAHVFFGLPPAARATWYVVAGKYGQDWETRVVSGRDYEIEIAARKASGGRPTTGPSGVPAAELTAVAVAALDRNGNAGAWTTHAKRPDGTWPAMGSAASAAPTATRATVAVPEARAATTRGAKPAVGGDAALAAKLAPILSRLSDSGAVYSARVVDLQTGRELFTADADVPVIPASNGKLVPSAALLAAYGPTATFRTLLLLDGKDLILQGEGDPGLGDADIEQRYGRKMLSAYDDFAAALTARGVKVIEGDLVYYDGAFDDERYGRQWPEAHKVEWYGAPVAGLNFNNNCIDFVIRPATRPGEAAIVEMVPPNTPGVRVVNKTTTAATRPATLPSTTQASTAPATTRATRAADVEVDVNREAGELVFTVVGTVRETTTLARPVLDPGLFAAQTLREHLKSRGIEVRGTIRRANKPVAVAAADARVVAVNHTRISDLLRRINKNSQNNIAEAASKLVARHHSPNEPGSFAGGETACLAFLRSIGVDPGPLVVADGSGLSRANKVSARLMTDLLAAMWKHPAGRVWFESLGEGGVDGTIGSRFTDFPGMVRAKTGYINGVRSLSGYVQTQDGGMLAFSIIYNGIPGAVGPYQRLQDEAVRVLHETRTRSARP